ncbi:SLC13 family permease [Abyssalbus ytuae]|uniref:SLC13 family permease n=1 Tax=Abyssalbus ytuae TaxID=2926907 RepID=A0A9E7CYL6_9FLAO|nr:SLC13 family permease [Abyssalbus ytuae]UOB16765.1 SLC13 family permease [Abyssalbus ytuae]
MNNLKRTGLILGPILFASTLLFFKPENLNKEGVAVLATTLWVAVWWIFEVIPIAITAMLPIILFPLSGAMSLDETTAAYGHKYVFLYVGGFILAIAIEKWNLHKRIALSIITIIGTSMNRIILGFMVATAFLSMWISNTATAVMILPIGLAIVSQLRDNPITEQDENLLFGKALMLSIAYSASIGGISTLIGTPPNIILAGVLEESYGIDISFSQWMMVGLPLSVILLLTCWFYITRFAFSFKQKTFPGGKKEIKKLLKELGKITYEEKTVLIVFAITAFLWITRSFIWKKIIPGIDDTIIALIFSFSLFLIPTGSKTKERNIMDWKSAVKLPWGILLLFGGGIALANGFKNTGLADWIGNQITFIEGVSLIILLIILVAGVNFLTEITSNLATTAMLLPVMIPVSATLNVHPFILMVGITLSASCAFMLPVATPPNAIVFGSGYLKIPDMVKAGVWMNLISILIVVLFTYFLLPLFWDFDPSSFPMELKK